MKLRSVLLSLNLLVFILPIAGILGLRVYDTQLVRQTQAELLGQGAVIVAVYRQALQQLNVQGHEVQLSSDPQPLINTPLIDQGLTEMLPRAEDAPLAEADAPSAIAAGLLARVLENTKRETLAGIRLLDHRGVVVGTSGTESGMSLTQREEVQRALQGQNASVLRQRVANDPAPAPLNSLSRNTGWRVFVALPVLQGSTVLGVVVISRTPMTLGGALWQDRYFLTTWVAVMLAVVFLFSLLCTWLIDRPVSQLKAMAEAVTRGEAPVPHRFKTPEELASLADAFALMAKTLDARSSYIKTFAAAVSHEFKTPLTSMRGVIELLSDHLDTMSMEQRKKFLSQLEGDTERLDRLVRRLLDLARADTAKADSSRVDVKPVLERLAAQKTDASLEVRVDAEPAVFPFTEETLETIVSNLIDNARQHAKPASGHVIVELHLREHTLTIKDNGSGVSALNADKIFDPFFTTSRERGGTGLGLNICKSLTEAAGGKLVFVGSDSGATFRLSFPR